jgi:hypothetical protein
LIATYSDTPTVLTASSITSTSIALSWLAPAYNGGSAIIKYEIFSAKNDENWHFSQECTDTFSTVIGLTA